MNPGVLDDVTRKILNGLARRNDQAAQVNSDVVDDCAKKIPDGVLDDVTRKIFTGLASRIDPAAPESDVDQVRHR